MKKVIIGSLLSWFGLVSWVSCATGSYIELKSGLCVPQEKAGVHYKKAPCFSAEWGKAWDAWRLGLQVGYTRYDIKNADQNSNKHGTVFDVDVDEVANSRFMALSVMANLYRDWHLCEKTTLYLGCGLGVVRLNYHFLDINDILGRGFGKSYDQDKCLFAMQLLCGVAYDLNEHWSVSLGYRCMKMESVKYNMVGNWDLWPSLKTPFLHALEVGLRYNF